MGVYSSFPWGVIIKQGECLGEEQVKEGEEEKRGVGIVGFFYFCERGSQFLPG